MSEEQFETSMSLPLDSDGFLRRECPTCEREFKVFAKAGDDAEAADAGDECPPGGYRCPYCVVQAPPENWFTKPQIELAQSILTREFIDPTIDDFADEMRKAGGGLIDIDVERSESVPPEPLTEGDDMRRVDFACHPATPVKVLDDWTRPTHCFICGTPA
jgi:hypothetical protein